MASRALAAPPLMPSPATVAPAAPTQAACGRVARAPRSGRPTPSRAAGTVALALTLVAGHRRAKMRSPAVRPRAACRAVEVEKEPVTFASLQPRGATATTKAKQFNFNKLEQYSVAELEELYVDSKWCYYKEDVKIITDEDFDKLKLALKTSGSRFATLTRAEVAYIEASLAFYQGSPILSDEEFDKLKTKVSASGRRKDITAFILYARGRKYLTKQQLGKMKEAFVHATQVNFRKLDDESLADLEELYIDALWCYYREGKPLLQDKEYDALKKALYKRESRFPTLTPSEVAFVEAAVAYYRGQPVVSDEEYEALKAEVKRLGLRKEVTAFLLYERGEQFLDEEQFQAMKDEYEKLGLTAVNLEQCNLAQLEEMYVDALWAYYKDGVQLLTDQQYDRLVFELQCQGSGFPSLSPEEIQFVEASLSFWRGEPKLSDEEWKELKGKVLADGKRKEISAFLLYSKGQQVLNPETFEEMKDEMARLGVTVQKAGTKALDLTLNIGSDRLENDLGQVAFMVGALGFIPTILCTALVWVLGLLFDIGFVPQPEWKALLSAEALPLFGAGLLFGVALTGRLLVFLDLQNPQIQCGVCPSCSSEIKTFVGGEKPEVEVAYSCKDCGCKMVLNTRDQRITKAGLGARVQGEAPESFDWKKAWDGLRGIPSEKVSA